MSAAPVTIGGFNYRLNAKLDPANLANDVGTMTITGTGAGGSFAATLTVFGEIDFTPLNGGPTIPAAFTQKTFTSTANWTSTPSTNAVLVSGLVGNQNANRHTNLATGQKGKVVTGRDALTNGPGVLVPRPKKERER